MSEAHTAKLFEVQTLIEQGRFDEACDSMQRIVDDESGNHELWFMYACCLNESYRKSEAVDAALRSWIESGHELPNAMVLATQLIQTVEPVSADAVTHDTSDNAVAALRAELQRGLVKH